VFQVVSHQHRVADRRFLPAATGIFLSAV